MSGHGLTSDIKIAIKKRQHYWLTGYFHEYLLYRNKTRKLCRRARRLFYLPTVKDSGNYNPRKWWNNIKQQAGVSKRQPPTIHTFYMHETTIPISV